MKKLESYKITLCRQRSYVNQFLNKLKKKWEDFFKYTQIEKI